MQIITNFLLEQDDETLDSFYDSLWLLWKKFIFVNFKKLFIK